MITRPRRYLAFMLRLWLAADEGGMPWRASLESPHTGERHGFAGLQALFAFLEEQTRSPDDPSATSDERKEQAT